jgi:uncharacterized membrane protein
VSVPKALLLAFIVIGLVDSAYLTAVHYTNLPLYCPESGIVNCVQVTTSAYSTVAGIPIALGGVVWFAVMGVIVFGLPGMKVIRNIWYIFALGAVAYSAIGQALLGEICIYCCVLDALLLLCVVVGIRYRAAIFPS